MSAITLSGPAARPAERSSRGFFRRLLDSAVASREDEARRQIRRILSSYSDESLAAFGLTRAEIERWHGLPEPRAR